MIRTIVSALLLLSIKAFAVVGITGTSKLAPGTIIKFCITEDFISGKKTELARTRVVSAGSFHITFELRKTHLVYIQYKNYETSLHVRPEDSYDVILKEDSIQQKTFGKLITVPLIINNLDSNNINYKTRSIDNKIDDFFTKNLNEIYKRTAKPKAEIFKKNLLEKLKVETDPYVKTYLEYNLALLDDAIGHTRKKISNEYLRGPVLYDNAPYMAFFNQFFTKYLANQFLCKHEKQFKAELNNNRSFQGLALTLKKADTLLTNDTLVQLILIKGLKELYYQKGFNQQNIAMVLNAAADGKALKPAMVAAKNTLQILTKLQKGIHAPDFILTDSLGKDYSLKTLKGKYTLLLFDASWCDACLQENKALSKLYDKNKDKLQIITVVVDSTIESLSHTYRANKFNWPIIDGTNNEKLLEDYSVKSLPLYYMIDPEGDLYLSPAPAPSEGLESYLLEVIKKGSK